MTQQAPVVPRRSRNLLFGVIGGATVLVGAPALGLLGTVLLVQRAYDKVASVDPSEKARFLAEGISEAMNCVAAGIVVGLVGAVVLGVCLVAYLRANRTRVPNGEAAPQQDPLGR